jgi:tRNA A37 threonylcarbamoyladenosine biosynthesis protein TsaE
MAQALFILTFCILHFEFLNLLIFLSMSIFNSFSTSFALNNGQRAAAYAISEFIHSSDAQVFILRGYAGTGKTTLMEGVIRYLRSEERNVLAMAPTGRAARVLSSKTGANARTIHSIIYKQRAVELKEDGVKRRFEINANAPSDATVLIADEVSMLSNECDDEGETAFGTGKTLSDLITYINFVENPNTKLIFIGDDAQLLPVKGKLSPALSAAYLSANFGLRVEEAMLSQVMRHDNEILNVATKVREKLSLRDFEQVCPSPKGEVSVVKHGDLLATFLQENPNVTDAHDSVLIVASNDKAFEYNMFVRQRYFPLGEGTAVVGDRLMVCTNVYGLSESLMNGEIIEVCAVGEQIVRRHNVKSNRWEWEQYRDAKIKPAEIEFDGFDNAKVTLRFRKMQVRVYGGARVDMVVLNDFLFSAATELPPLVRRALMLDLRERVAKQNPNQSKAILDAKFLEAMNTDLYFNAVPVKFGYAITCHKAQGGEWKRVYANICTMPNHAKTAEHFRWVYTAMTRASETLTLGAPYIPFPDRPRNNYQFARKW